MRTRNVWTCCAALMALGFSAAGAAQRNSGPQGSSSNKQTPTASAPPVQKKASEDSAAAKLPVRHVVLYKTGVGYFEHVGQIRGNQNVRVDFTSSQLNDVLQSLTILDLSGGRIAGVNYNSEAPLSQRSGLFACRSRRRPTSRNFTARCAALGCKSEAARAPSPAGS
jgi:hypothetical protein